MHELSICEGILSIIEDQAKEQAFSRVRRVRLEVGPFSGVEIEALRFGFDVVTRSSVAEGALLEIFEPPGAAWCMSCSQTVAIENRYDLCPVCGSHQLQVTGGTELRIRDLEVD